VTLFISDLHLGSERPAIVRLFLDFLATRARRADALYILGDLFEFWIGDEMAQLAPVAPIVAGLRALTDAGIPVHVMHGNRDFLLGAGFARVTGCQLLAEPARARFGGEEVLLLHGDTLCTDDIEYQRFRKMVRNPEFVRDFLAKSVEERAAIAQNLRETSQAAIAGKKPEIMDVNENAVRDTMRAQGVRHIIHGHTHRPAQHVFDLDGAPARRTVLGDWYEQGSVLEFADGTWRLESLPVGGQSA
jgi:UDP-2,3-diacylglucosamine hydrolase